MSNKRDILIIDDEQVILDAVSKIAESEGFKVDTVLDAKEALLKINQNNYSAILCDIMMPEMDGFQLLDKLNSDHKNIPVIMITGFSTAENAVNSLYKGAVDFIAKPFTFEEIISAIYRAIEYGKIQLKIENDKKGDKESSVIHVPCPPRYKRLGNISWMNLETQGTAVIGVTDMFLRTLHSVNNIEMMESENIVVQGNSCAKFEAENGLIHSCLAPIGGRIIERNEKLLTDPALLEKDPYFKGWIYRIIPSAIGYEIKYLIPCSSDRM